MNTIVAKSRCFRELDERNLLEIIREDNRSAKY